MSMMKLMPMVALAGVGAAGFVALKDNANIIGKFQSAATLNGELKFVADAVAIDYTESNQLPLNNFSEFLRSNMRENKGGTTRDPALDMWDTPYKLTQVKSGFEVSSAGPDTKWATEDDLSHYYDLSGISTRPPSGGGSSDPSRANTQTQTQQAKRQPARKRKGPVRKRTSSEEVERNVLEFQMRRAIQGSAQSQYDLALRYLSADGVEFSAELGREWLTKSANGGHKPAQEKLKMLEMGLDVTP